MVRIDKNTSFFKWKMNLIGVNFDFKKSGGLLDKQRDFGNEFESKF
jgi:hypothetical protein